MKDFTKEEMAYFQNVEGPNEDAPLSSEQEDELLESRKQAQKYTANQGFDAVAHARTKVIGSNTGEVDKFARGREQQMKSCPLLAQVRQNNKEAETRLRNATNKTYPDEARPEDQYKHLGLSDEQVRESISEFIKDVSSDMGASEKRFASIETLFKQGPSSKLIGDLRKGIRACLYCYHTNSSSKIDKMLRISSKELYKEDFLDWYYNYQHYTLGEVHMMFSEFYEKLMEKSLEN